MPFKYRKRNSKMRGRKVVLVLLRKGGSEALRGNLTDGCGAPIPDENIV